MQLGYLQKALFQAQKVSVTILAEIGDELYFPCLFCDLVHFVNICIMYDVVLLKVQLIKIQYVQYNYHFSNSTS